MAEEIYPVFWDESMVAMIDQTLLPGEYKELRTNSHEEVARWIETMVVRGAPAIGVAAAYGMALAANEFVNESDDEFFRKLSLARDRLGRTRPTAVNLFWALERMMDVAEGNS